MHLVIPRRSRRTSRMHGALVATVVVAFAVGACSGQGQSAAQPDKPPDSAEARMSDSTVTPPAAPGPDPVVGRVTEGQWRQMIGAGIVRPECPIKRPGQLRRIEINHLDFQGRVRRGELIVNTDVADSVVRIFSQLYEAKFPIRRMKSAEAYAGDSDASLRADNTSAFNCRRGDQINAPFTDSPHANGRAIDVNPRENPWMDLRCDCWSPTAEFAERRKAPGTILKGGIVWRAFIAEGWLWQNIDVPDYMHFDTGYPSAAFQLQESRRRERFARRPAQPNQPT